MSRIIVKCLPKKITEDRFRTHFTKVGQVTDAKLKFTTDGKFRQFGFIGYKTEEEANKAVEYFNNTFIDASRLIVEPCKPLNDPDKQRAWSKYSKESSVFKKKNNKTVEEPKIKKEKEEDLTKKKSKSKTIVDELLGPLKEDEGFKEFVAATKAIKSKENVWKDDIDYKNNEEEVKKSDKNNAKKSADLKFDDDSGDSSDDDEYFDMNKKKNHPQNTNNDEVDDKEEEEEEIEEKPKAIKTDDSKEEKKVEKKVDDDEDEADFENGRLYLRNLCYSCKEEDLEKLFAPYGPLVETNMPIDNFSKRPKGFAYITCMFPEKALKAFNELDGTIFQGRMLHIIPAKSKKEQTNNENSNNTYKSKKEVEQKKSAQSSHNWNSLFVNQDAVANLMASRYNVDKSELFDVHAVGKKKGASVAVKLAVGETQIVNDMRKFLVRNGVKLDAFTTTTAERSKTVFLIKNLPNGTTEKDLRELFTKYNLNGTIKRLVMPEYGVAALVEFGERQEARDAFKKLAYRKFKSVPVYLEWAPVDVFNGDEVEKAKLDQEAAAAAAAETNNNEPKNKNEEEKKKTVAVEDKDDNEEDDEDGYFDQVEADSTLFVKNLNFDTTEAVLKKLFKKIARCKATIARKISPNKESLSMGYGFVQFKKAVHAREAIKSLQNHSLDGHMLELKLSNRASNNNATSSTNGRNSNQKQQKQQPKEKSTKLLVRNIPFEAKAKEIEELFRVFGELKYVRLPKKIDGAHRGFGFVEFVTLNDAQRAYEALCHSTHLFGRRLVLEWAEAEQTQDVEILRMKEEQLSGPRAKKLKKSQLLDDLGQNEEYGAPADMND